MKIMIAVTPVMMEKVSQREPCVINWLERTGKANNDDQERPCHEMSFPRYRGTADANGFGEWHDYDERARKLRSISKAANGTDNACYHTASEQTLLQQLEVPRGPVGSVSVQSSKPFVKSKNLETRPVLTMNHTAKKTRSLLSCPENA